MNENKIQKLSDEQAKQVVGGMNIVHSGLTCHAIKMPFKCPKCGYTEMLLSLKECPKCKEKGENTKMKLNIPGFWELKHTNR